MISGGKILVEALAAHGVRRIFAVAGESYLPVLDALLDYPEIEVITCRHESGASFMAEAHANLTGEVGIVLVTRAPGACNASIGIHTAKQSSTPVILFSGLIRKDERGREAFQDFDIVQMFASHTKHGEVIDEISDIPAYVARAFEIAKGPRPGPVVIGFPEEVVFNKGAAEAVTLKVISKISAAKDEIDKLTDMLRSAQRPVILAGGGMWGDEDCAALVRFSEQASIPVALAFRRQDMFDNNHANYIGELGFGANPALVKRVQAADLVLVLGARLNDTTTQGYTLFKPGQEIVHVYQDASVFGKSCTPTMTITAHGQNVLSALLNAKVAGAHRAAWCAEARADYIAFTANPGPMNLKGADMTQIFCYLRDHLPKDAIVTTDAGNFSGWAYRFLRYKRPMRVLAPVSGAMGYGVPAAVAASLENKHRLVLGVCGDGGFMMTGQEIATAMHHGAKPIILVCNNNIFGTIRMHQEKHFPDRISATDLTNPDFVRLAESYGAFGACVDHADQFPAVWEKAVKCGKPALIEIRMDRRQMSTGTRL